MLWVNNMTKYIALMKMTQWVILRETSYLGMYGLITTMKANLYIGLVMEV